MKETQKIWRIGKTAALLLLAVLLTCAVIVPAAAEDSSAVFTQQEIQGMMTAGSVFSDVFDNALYNSLSDDAKADYMATVLGSLSGPAGSTPALMSSVPGLPSANVNQQAQIAYQMQTNSILQQYDLSAYSEPLIDRNSIYYDADAKTFSFTYNTGVLAAVKVGRDPCCHGIDEDAFLRKIENSSLSEKLSSINTLSPNSVGSNALLILDFDNTMRATYLTLSNTVLTGSNLLEQPTIANYKTALNGKKLVLISAHGDIFTVSTFPYVRSTGLDVGEQVTSDKISAYDSDLTTKRVGLIYDAFDIFHTNGKFVIFPSFFSYYYGSNRGFEGAYVHLGICKGFGENGNDDYAFAYALNQGGASVVTGYNNFVNVWYDHEMTNTTVRRLVSGENIQTAINAAKTEHGYTDSGWGIEEKNDAYLVTYGYIGWTL